VSRLMFAVTAGMILATAVLTGTSGAADAILINFTSASCGPCQAMRPTLAQLERMRVPVRHVDVAAEPEVALRYGIRKTPTFVVVADGKEVTRMVGTQSLEQLRAALAIDPRGPLIRTGLQRPTDSIPAPLTRLAPVNRLHVNPPADMAKTLTTAAAPAPRAEPMPSVSLADSVERAAAATVRLKVHDGHGYGTGTGTIIDTHGDEALVLTCGHLFRETKGQGKIEVDLFVGGQTRTVPGRVLDYDSDNRDIALVAIRPGFSVQPVSVISAEDRVVNGQTAFSFGCDRGDDPSRRDTRITGINKYNQHLGVSNLEIAGAPIDGRSGGGLFDAAGRLIGVCNAADYKGDIGIYAGPGNVYWQLDRVGMSALYKTPATRGLPGGDSPNQLAVAATAPAGRIASLPSSNRAGVPAASYDPSVIQASVIQASVIQASALAPPANAAPLAAGQAMAAGQEVIVIVRDRNHPEAISRVMTLAQPSAELLRMIEQQAQ
jgi:thiol-disulfide isomerase/thioredoxin